MDRIFFFFNKSYCTAQTNYLKAGPAHNNRITIGIISDLCNNRRLNELSSIGLLAVGVKRLIRFLDSSRPRCIACEYNIIII